MEMILPLISIFGILPVI